MTQTFGAGPANIFGKDARMTTRSGKRSRPTSMGSSRAFFAQDLLRCRQRRLLRPFDFFTTAWGIAAGTKAPVKTGTVVTAAAVGTTAAANLGKQA
jgi:hypothetical protein